MAHYRFLVADSEGHTREERVDAADEAEALRKLSARHLTPVRVLGQAYGERMAVGLLDFTDRLSSLLGSGVPLERALAVLAAGAERESQAGFYRELRQSLREGKSFSAACAERPGLFPPFYLSMLEVGERTGALDQVMAELLDTLQQRKEQQDFILSRSIYPAIILTVSLAVVLFLLIYVIPKFAVIFEGGSRQPTGATQTLLQLSAFLKATWWWMLPSLAAAAAGTYALLGPVGKSELPPSLDILTSPTIVPPSTFIAPQDEVN